MGKDFLLRPLDPQTVISLTDIEEVQFGKYIFPIGIIAGYNKLERISIRPLNAMLNTFYYDCLNSDIIITIGYSFNDIHLNSYLKEALNRDHVKFFNITKNHEGYLNDTEWMRVKNEILNPKNNDFLKGKTTNGSWQHSKNRIHHVYLEGFDNFLLEKQWKKVK